tara:strand:- start:3250 stop:3648 length:399 start_codon:yes stop_codon:yes gene_type:complete
MRHIERNHPYPDLGDIYVYDKDDDIPRLQSSRQTYLTDCKYYDLEDTLGIPTYDTPSADDKVQKEWVCKYVPKDLKDTPDFYLFRIYDYKSESLWNTMNTLTEWSIGGQPSTSAHAEDFAKLIQKFVSIKEL